jgi:hypothetical protein
MHAIKKTSRGEVGTAFDRREGEADETFLNRVRVATTVAVMHHLISDGWQPTCTEAAQCLYDIRFSYRRDELEACFNSWTIASFRCNRDEQAFTKVGFDFRRHVCMLSGAILLALLNPQARLTITFAEKKEVLEPTDVVYTLTERGLFRMGARPVCVWSRDQT